MEIKTDINIDSIEGLVKDIVAKKLSMEVYNKCFHNFINSKSAEIQVTINSKLKTELNSLVAKKLESWKNSDGETLEEYLDRRLEETVKNIDFEKIIKDKYLK